MFKPGDRVRIVEPVEDNYGDYTIGDEATIERVDRVDGLGALWVSWETNLLDVDEAARVCLLFAHEVDLVP